MRRPRFDFADDGDGDDGCTETGRTDAATASTAPENSTATTNNAEAKQDIKCAAAESEYVETRDLSFAQLEELTDTELRRRISGAMQRQKIPRTAKQANKDYARLSQIYRKRFNRSFFRVAYHSVHPPKNAEANTEQEAYHMPDPRPKKDEE